MFRRHTLLDGHPLAYASAPGAHMGHQHFGKAPFNIGDIFVTEAVGRLLDFDEILVFDYRADEAVFEEINQTCKAVIFIGQNALKTGFFETSLSPSLLARITIPVVLLSLGVQAPSDQDPELTEDDITSLRLLHERCASSQLRGERAARLLARHGIHNTEVLGCPSLFWSNKRNLEIRPLQQLSRVGWTITHNPGEIYSGEGRGNNHQNRWLSVLAEKTERLIPIAQGGEFVLQKHILARDEVSRFDRTDHELIVENGGALTESPFTTYSEFDKSPSAVISRFERIDPTATANSVKWVYRTASEKAQAALVNDSFFSNRLCDFMHNARSLDLMLGTRLHGNIMALAQGIPTAFHAHDARLQEMVSVIGAPAFDFWAEPSAEGLLDLDWSAFKVRYTELYDGFRQFLERNGIPHRMQPAPQTATPDQEFAA